MQVVKVIILYVTSLSFFQLNAQKNIVGSYEIDSQKNKIEGKSVKYIFNKDRTFIIEENKHIESSITYYGNYYVKNDTLKLFYKQVRKQPISKYEFIKKEKILHDNNEFYFTSKIKCYLDEKPVEGAILNLKNSEGEMVISFLSNRLGVFPDINVSDSYIAELNISYLGFDEIIISNKELKNYNSSIEASFITEGSQKEYNVVDYFLLKSIEKERIILFDAQTKNKIILNAKR